MNAHEQQWESCPSGLMGEMAEGLRSTRARRQTMRSFASASIVLVLLIGGVVLTNYVVSNSSAPPVSITCRECLDKLVDYREGVLAPAIRASVQAHLEGCPSCHDAYQKMSGGNDGRGESTSQFERGDLALAMLKSRP